MNRRALLQFAALAPLFALAARVKARGAFTSEATPKRWLRARWDAGRDVATVEHADSPDGPWSPCTSSDWTPWRTDSACGFRYTPRTYFNSLKLTEAENAAVMRGEPWA